MASADSCGNFKNMVAKSVKAESKEKLYMFDIVLQGRTDDPEYVKEKLHSMLANTQYKLWKSNIEFEALED